MDCSNFCANFVPVEVEKVVSLHPVGSPEYMAERENARTEDWWTFRGAMDNAANVETKKEILEWWRDFRVLKYGNDRVNQYGEIDCRLPIPTKWEPIDAEIFIEEMLL